MLSGVLAKVEADCRASGQMVHWEAFAAAVIEPTLRQASTPAMADLATRLGVSEPTQVSSMIQTVRRKFRRLLRKAIENTVADPSLTEEEFRDLKAFWGL